MAENLVGLWLEIDQMENLELVRCNLPAVQLAASGVAYLTVHVQATLSVTDLGGVA